MGRLPGVGDGVWLGVVLSALRLRVSLGDCFDVSVLVQASLGLGVRGALVLPLMALLGPALEQRAGLAARATTTLFVLARLALDSSLTLVLAWELSSVMLLLLLSLFVLMSVMIGVGWGLVLDSAIRLISTPELSFTSL